MFILIEYNYKIINLTLISECFISVNTRDVSSFSIVKSLLKSMKELIMTEKDLFVKFVNKNLPSFLHYKNMEESMIKLNLFHVQIVNRPLHKSLI
jgi:hypothetical protein